MPAQKLTLKGTSQPRVGMKPTIPLVLSANVANFSDSMRITAIPRMHRLLWTFHTLSGVKRSQLVHKGFCKKKDNSLRVDMVTIRKFAFVEGDHLATDVRSGCSSMDRHEVLRSWYAIPISSTATIPHSQLWDLDLLLSVQPVCDLHSQIL